MTTTIHKNLTGADLHEPKGADAALSGQVYVADGAGSGAWVLASSVVTNTAFTTGDLKPTHKTSADTGWILWSDGTIGDGSSSATIRANVDTSALFTLYWANANCLISGGKGVSAAADFAAHKAISVPPGAGRALGIAGSGSGLTTRAVGVSVGTSETVTLITANLPAYTPTGTVALTNTLAFSYLINLYNISPSGSGTSLLGSGPTGVFANQTGTITAAFTGTAQGGTSTPFTNMQPSAFVNVMIKL